MQDKKTFTGLRKGICSILLFFCVPCFSNQTPSNSSSLRALYSALDPLSLLQHLAFYELYPDTLEGKKALAHVLDLFKQHHLTQTADLSLPLVDLQSIVSLVTRQPSEPPIQLSENQLTLIETMCQKFPNRKLKGHSVWTKEEVLALKTEDVDLTRGLLLFQFEDSKNLKNEIRQYEARLDLMALQILVRLSPQATNEEKIREINRFIFQEMQFRFPPHSLYAHDIDLYTFLPSVLDSRQGVCLGVSILYLCLAQRLDLPLEIITPPGHIFLRYHENDTIINIETTARGVNFPTEIYLGVNTKKLIERALKEVIALAFINQAAVFWEREDYASAVSLYEKAKLFLNEDPLLKFFLGLNYLFTGKNKEGRSLLKDVAYTTFEDTVSRETIPEDFLAGKINVEGLKTIFLHVDETRSSIEKKQQALQKIIKRFPRFRAGLLQLATTYLQLNRSSEALDILTQYHKIDPTNIIVEYYLALLSVERLDYNQGWQHLQNAEHIALQHHYVPLPLKNFRLQLRRLCPES
jgi:tetratricopeptide (TPR) repeat protein